MPMEITFMDNGGNIFVLDEFIEHMNWVMLVVPLLNSSISILVLRCLDLVFK